MDTALIALHNFVLPKAFYLMKKNIGAFESSLFVSLNQSRALFSESLSNSITNWLVEGRQLAIPDYECTWFDFNALIDSIREMTEVFQMWQKSNTMDSIQDDLLYHFNSEFDDSLEAAIYVNFLMEMCVWCIISYSRV